MRIDRRAWLAITLAAVGMNFAAAAERPDDFPSKPITFVVPWTAGGTTDLTSRKLCELASVILGQPILIENKGGGAGAIGTTQISKAKPDGYTIGNLTQSVALFLPHLRDVPFDVRKDFSFIAQYGEFVHAFTVKSDAPWKTFDEFIQDARKKPGKMTHSSVGPKSRNYLFLRQIFDKEHVSVTHVPYEGSNDETIAVLGGHVDAGFLSSASFVHFKSGKLRPLAIDAKSRLADLPDVPTFRELGYEIESPTFLGVVGPAGIPDPILAKLRDAFSRAAKDPVYVDFQKNLGVLSEYLPGDAFRDMILRNYEIQGKLLRD